MATKTIAAYNSPAEKKAIADYVCDGSADQEEINAAINSGAYDIILFEGTYNITGSIHVRGGTVFSGEGAEKTFLKFTNNAHLFLSEEYTVARDFNIEGTGYTNSMSVWLGVLTVRASHCTVYRVKGTADNTPGCVFFTLSSEDTPGNLLQDVEWNECECVDTGTYGFLHNWWDGQVEKKTHVNMRYINCKAIRCGNANGTGAKGQRNNWVTGFDFAELNDMDGLYVKGCSAEGCWESGFHMEWDPHKVNCVFEDCVSKFNGAKPTYPNQTVNPFPGFVTGAGEFFGCGYYLPNFVGRLTRCYSEGNSRCGFWVTNGGVLTDCVDKDCGIGRTPNEYLQPMSFMGNPCRTPFEGYSLKLIRCKSINSRCYAFWYDYAAHIYMEDCEVYGGQGYNGVLNYFGSEVSNYFYDSNISFARIECPANLTAINAHQNIRVKYGPGVLVSDAEKPFTITGSSTNSVLVENWTTVSQTLTPGPGGVFLEEGASSAQVTQNNVVITDTDPGVPPVEPPEEGVWLAPVGPPPVTPGDWAFPEYRYRREVLISGEMLSNDVTDVPIRLPLIYAFSNSLDPTTQRFYNRIGSNFLKLKAATEDGEACWLSVTHWPSDDPNRSMLCGEAFLRAPLIKAGKINRYYIYYGAEGGNSDTTVRDGTKNGKELAYEPNFKAVWNYPWNPTSNDHFVQSVSKNPVLPDIGLIAGINTSKRIADLILGSALDMRQILQLPFNGGDAFHDLTGAMTVECHLKFVSFPAAPVGEWKYCFPICKGYAASSGRSWTLAVRDNGTGYFFIRKPDDSGWVNNAEAFGPIPLQQKVYIACVFDPNNKIRVHVLTESGNYSVFETSIPDVGASYRSEYQGGFNIAYGHGLFNGYLYHASISGVARSEDWIKLRGLTLGDNVGSYVMIGDEEEQPEGTVDSRTLVAYVKKISAEALVPGGMAERLVVGTVKPIVAEVSVFRRAETYQVVATIQKIVATTYSDIYSVTRAIIHVGVRSAFTEVITHSNRVQVVQSSIRPINGAMRSYGIPYVEAPDGPGVFAAEDLQIEVRDSDGALIAILDNAHNIRIVQEDNAPTILEFDLPADDRKGDNLTLANEIWIRSVKTGGIVAKFKLHKKTDTRGI